MNERFSIQKPNYNERFRDIAHRYRLILCDIWGVLHDGSEHHAETVQSLIKFRKLADRGYQRRVILMSNSPRPKDTIPQSLRQYGVPETAYDAVVTSGELTKRWLSRMKNVPFVHIGQDYNLNELLNGQPYVQPEHPEFLLCTGYPESSSEALLEHLPMWAQKGLPMLCANPDRIVYYQGRTVLCAGELAEMYRNLQGKVYYIGKPYPQIYEESLHIASTVGSSEQSSKQLPLQEVLAIGDNSRTDILGACNFGIDSFLTTSGVHRFAFESFHQHENPKDWQIPDDAFTYAAPTYYNKHVIW